MAWIAMLPYSPWHDTFFTEILTSQEAFQAVSEWWILTDMCGDSVCKYWGSCPCKSLCGTAWFKNTSGSQEISSQNILVCDSKIHKAILYIPPSHIQCQKSYQIWWNIVYWIYIIYLENWESWKRVQLILHYWSLEDLSCPVRKPPSPPVLWVFWIWVGGDSVDYHCQFCTSGKNTLSPGGDNIYV